MQECTEIRKCRSMRQANDGTRRFQRRARQEADKQALQTRILETARKQFATGTIETVSIQKIADALGYSKGTVLKYFPTKILLLLAVKQQNLQEIGDRLRTRSRPHSEQRDPPAAGHGGLHRLLGRQSRSLSARSSRWLERSRTDDFPMGSISETPKSPGAVSRIFVTSVGGVPCRTGRGSLADAVATPGDRDIVTRRTA